MGQKEREGWADWVLGGDRITGIDICQILSSYPGLKPDRRQFGLTPAT